jgi:hypothetical protein
VRESVGHMEDLQNGDHRENDEGTPDEMNFPLKTTYA